MGLHSGSVGEVQVKQDLGFCYTISQASYNKCQPLHSLNTTDCSLVRNSQTAYNLYELFSYY